MKDTIKKLTMFDYICVFFFSIAFITGFLCAVLFVILQWWPIVILFGLYVAAGSYIIDYLSLRADRTGYICDKKIIDDISSSLTTKIWQQILARRQTGTIYTEDELLIDIKQNVKFLNDYGFKK